MKLAKHQRLTKHCKSTMCCVWLVIQLCLTIYGPHQTPLSMGFSRQECWSGLLFSSPRDLPGPGIKPVSPALAGRFFTTELLGKPFLLNRKQLFLLESIYRCLQYKGIKVTCREFPGSPVAETCQSLGSIPGQGTKIPQATQHAPSPQKSDIQSRK